MRHPTIGVDVAKDHLDACRLPDREARRFDNTKPGRDALIRWIGKDVERVVFEPTGHYARPLERGLAEAGLPAVKVNPARARRFAEAAGLLAKTDRVDAEMLARMGCQLDLALTPPLSPAVETLKELRLARRALDKDRTAAKNRAKRLTLPLLKRQNARRLRQIQRDLDALDAEIQTRIRAAPDLARKADILESVPGLSQVTAAAILADMPELGNVDAKAVAALAGLAPFARQSGAWKGRAAIRAGRAELRQALYMPALVAARFNPDMKRLYDRLIDAGKPAKVAITAVMRKLIVLANALIAQNRTWAKTIP